MNSIFTRIVFCACVCGSLSAADKTGVERMEWQIDGVAREALVHVPADARSSATPVLFAFHGHGGTAKNAAFHYNYQKLWPEALVVYMQGLPTVGKTDPEGVKPGWQKAAGDLNDRDLKFFDAVLVRLRKDYKLDEKRMYVTGHSNGGGFTYLLWGARGEVFAAVAPAAAGVRNVKDYKPLPALHVAGEKDELVPFDMQTKVMAAVRKLNGCDAVGSPWATIGTLVGTIYPSKTETPFVSLIYPGTHKFPDEAPEMIVKFFKEHAKN